MLDNASARFTEALATTTIGLSVEEYTGTCVADAAPTGKVWSCGGEWSPVAAKYLAPPITFPLRLKCSPGQFACLDLSNRLIAILAGQRAGKTVTGQLLIYKALLGKPKAKVILLVPRLSKEGLVSDDLLRDLAPWVARIDRSTHVYEMINGSVLRVFSLADKRQENSFLGFEADLLVIEEAREVPSRVLKSAFSRIISRNGQMVIISSPEVGHIIEDIAKGEMNAKVDVAVRTLSTPDNFFAFADTAARKVLDEAKSLYDDATYRRDVLGEFVAAAAQDYYTFKCDRHIIDRPPGDPVTTAVYESEDLWLSKDSRWRGKGTVNPHPELADGAHKWILGMDFGATQTNAVRLQVMVPFENRNWIDLTWTNTIGWIDAEYHQENTSVLRFAQEVLKPNGLTPDNTVIICDPSGLARDHVVGESPASFLRRLGYHVVPASAGGARRWAGIAAVRQRFQVDRLFISRTCQKTIKSVLNMRSAGRSNDAIGKDPSSHLTDCLRYCVGLLWPEKNILRSDDALDLALKQYTK